MGQQGGASYKRLGNNVEQGVIDALKIETTKVFQNHTLFIFKENDATHFVNNGI